jgi:hypothetical protein
MSDDQIRSLMVSEFGIRIQAQMSLYVRQHLVGSDTAEAAAIPVIGGDARTGVAVRTLIPLELLRKAVGTSAAADAGA